MYSLIKGKSCKLNQTTERLFNQISNMQLSLDWKNNRLVFQTILLIVII